MADAKPESTDVKVMTVMIKERMKALEALEGDLSQQRPINLKGMNVPKGVLEATDQALTSVLGDFWESN